MITPHVVVGKVFMVLVFTDVAAVNVYTWGRNPNDTLGHDRSRKHPEKLELTLLPNDHITKVRP